ncbi:cytochrome P450 [Raphidocelis subcapitata]|uniref:Cytochrome P450 n=1 Tax=Raphidocelis subcapitata TaxID=307507 RepID=A0A2V0NKY3_9CHLO|nr:cytochrome P450 [Raphidocelis subcapitata]|eukprot:GBF88018.1 cytochrome P450 [Raphidocelis subcapitata]
MRVAAIAEPSSFPPPHDSAAAAPAPPPPLPDGRQPWWRVPKQLLRPAAYFEDVLKGRDVAVGQFAVFRDTVFIGSAPLARELLGSEARSGINIGWPPSFVKLIGSHGVSLVADPEAHKQTRALMMPFFSPDAVAAKMPAVQGTARRYLAEWVASPAPFSAYDGMKRFTFDVLVLELGLAAEEVSRMSALFQIWTRGFMPPTVPLPFTPMGKGMAARRKIRDTLLTIFAAGRLPPDGLVARLQAHFGDNTEAVIDNIITLIFAGHDTSSSALTSMLAALAADPRALARLADEQAAVLAAHGEALTPAAVAAAPYATAVIRETLRIRPVVAGAMRTAVRDVELPGGLVIPRGCPMAVAFSAMAAREPAWQADRGEFRPERFLTGGGSGSGGSGGPESLAPQPAGFNPFGIGTRYCLGSHLALAEMGAMVAELGRLGGSHALEVEQPGRWEEFPILRPDNGLPTRFVRKGPRASAAEPAGSVAADARGLCDQPA